MRDSVKVFAPASISNIGPGFDIMGFAINEPGDEIILKRNDSNEIRITAITGDEGKLPLDPVKNTATVAMQALLDKLGLKVGVDVQINKKMGLGSGLGSSAASAVAGVYALNLLLETNLSKDELLAPALAGEAVASKAIHADNVAPCLYGGFILIRGYDPIDIIEITTPKNLFCSVIYPDIEIKTCEARAILPKDVSLKDTITQCGNASGLIAGLMSNDLDLIGRSLNDVIVEPVRANLIKGYSEIKESALSAGAIGCSISGSGPSIFALSDSIEKGMQINEAMKKAAEKNGLTSQIYLSPINSVGPREIE